MKRFTSFILIFVIVVLAALWIVPSFLSWNSYKEQAYQAVEEYTGLKLEIGGDIKIALLPTPYAYLEDISLTNPEDQGDNQDARAIASMKRIDVSVSLLELMGGNVEISKLQLISPKIYLDQKSDGNWNWLTQKISGLTNQNDANTGSNADLRTKNETSASFGIEHAEIIDGSFLYAEDDQDVLSVTQLNLDGSAKSLNGPFEVEGSWVVYGHEMSAELEAKSIDAKTGLLPIQLLLNVNPYDEAISISFNGDVKTGNGFAVNGVLSSSIDNFSQAFNKYGFVLGSDFAKKFTLNSNVEIDANRIVTNNAHIALGKNELAANLSAQTDLSNIDIAIQSINLSGIENIDRLELKSKAALFGDLIQLKSLKIQIDESEIDAQASYKNRPGKRPVLNASLQSNALNMNKILGVSANNTGGAQSVPSNAAPRSNSISQDVIKSYAKTLSLPFDVSIVASLKSLKYGSYLISNIKTKFILVENALNIEELSIGDFSGASAKVYGSIQDVKNMQKADIQASANISDIKKLSQSVGVAIAAMPASINTVKLNSRLRGSLDIADVSFAAMAKNAELSASGRVQNLLAQQKIDNMSVGLKHQNLEQAVRMFSPNGTGFSNLGKPVRMKADVVKNGDRLQLTNITGDLAGMSVSGGADIDGLSSGKPSVVSKMKFGKVVLLPLKASASNQTKRSAHTATNEQGASIDTSWMNAADLDIQIDAQSLVYDTWNIAKPSAKILMRDNAVKISSLSGGLYEGVLDANILLQQVEGSGRPLQIATDAKLQNISLQPLMASMLGTSLIKGSGLVNMDVDLTSSGLRTNDFLKALAGQISTTGSDLVLQGFNLEKLAGALFADTKISDSVTGLWKTAANGGQTSFDDLSGTIDIAKGVASISKMDLSGAGANVDTTGSINLVKQTLATEHTISLKNSDLPEFTVNFDGPLTNPAQTFGQGAFEDYLSRKIDRKIDKLISEKLFDKKDGDTSTSKEEAVKGILRNFLQ